jgi:hypothetical protein
MDQCLFFLITSVNQITSNQNFTFGCLSPGLHLLKYHTGSTVLASWEEAGTSKSWLLCRFEESSCSEESFISLLSILNGFLLDLSFSFLEHCLVVLYSPNLSVCLGHAVSCLISGSKGVAPIYHVRVIAYPKALYSLIIVLQFHQTHSLNPPFILVFSFHLHCQRPMLP